MKKAIDLVDLGLSGSNRRRDQMALSKEIGFAGVSLLELFKSSDRIKHLLEKVIETVMAGEVAEHVGAGRHERSGDRRGHRNGYKPRTFRTRVGELELSVPQVRGCEPYSPSVFGKWERSERALLVACAEMYYQGVSTRNVRNVLEAMCDGQISSSTVSAVARELDEKLSAFRSRGLSGEYPYLVVDARYEKVRVEGKVVSQAVLVVVGINEEGGREILDWRLGDSESEASWGELFRELKDRGLKGVELLVSDAHSGIKAAWARHFQGVAWQRCRVHFKRELGKKVPWKVAVELMKEIAVVFAGEDAAECRRRGQEMSAKWRGRYPAVSRMIDEGLEDCLTVEGFPSHHRHKLRSTNLLENMMKRLKKRTRVVGVFPNRASCDRLIGSQLMELHEAWSCESKVYMNTGCTQ
jgi:putative transposase